MKLITLILACLFLHPISAATTEIQCIDDRKNTISDKQCEELEIDVDNNVYPNNISSRAQAVARAEAARLKQASTNKPSKSSEK